MNVPVLDPRTVPAQPFPYQVSQHSDSLIKDADGVAVFTMMNSNQQGVVTRDLILESINFVTEAESLAQTDVRVAAAYKELRDAVEATRGEFSESEAAA
jgi:GTP cyclohydrolase I